MSTERRPPVSATGVEPPTIEELRMKLAQYVIDAQRDELQREIARLANAAEEQREAEAA
jgi:hypothetical protein